MKDLNLLVNEIYKAGGLSNLILLVLCPAMFLSMLPSFFQCFDYTMLLNLSGAQAAQTSQTCVLPSPLAVPASLNWSLSSWTGGPPWCCGPSCWPSCPPGRCWSQFPIQFKSLKFSALNFLSAWVLWIPGPVTVNCFYSGGMTASTLEPVVWKQLFFPLMVFMRSPY